MANNFLNKFIRFIGWLLFSVSLLLFIVGISIINDEEPLGTGFIITVALFAVFGFFLTRYKKVKKAENTETPKKITAEKSKQKQDEIQGEINAKERPPEKEIIETQPFENTAENDSFTENLIYHIEYVDYQGKSSNRDIQINSFSEENGELYLNAFCYLKNEMRQFRVDRIESIAIKDGDPIDYPQQFLWNKYKNTDLYKLQMALNDHADEILTLIFIARADGKLLKNEREVICRYIDILIQGIDVDLVEKMLQKTNCELSNFNGILKRAKTWNSDVKELVLNAASQIVKLQKKPDPMQLATFDKLKAVIG